MSIPEVLFQTSPIPTPHCSNRPRPFVRIVEQPSKSLRYRYMCERRTGVIPGVSSTRENKTPFTIEVVGYQGKIVVAISCVTHKPPYRPHPHNLSGPNCKDGYCSMKTEVTAENPFISFPKLAVQCVKRQDIKKALKVRKEKNVDPFLTGFEHSEDYKAIDLHFVRLCVQVFLKEEGRIQPFVLAPVVSEPIFNRKTFPDPVIYRLSHCNSYVYGRQEDIILICTKIFKEDIKIRFFETKNGTEIWEDYGKFSMNDVYNSSAICFRPPRYHDQNITEPAKVFVELVRPSDGFSSPPVAFEYLPVESEPGVLKEKRKKYGTNPLFVQLFQNNSDVPMADFFKEETRWTLPQPVLPTSTQMVPYLEDSSSSSYQFNLNTVCDISFNTCSNLNDISVKRSSISSTQNDDTSSYNIMNSGDFPTDTINLETANAVCDVLNVDNGDQIYLQDIHISSGDLEMADVERLSGSLQEYLVI